MTESVLSSSGIKVHIQLHSSLHSYQFRLYMDAMQHTPDPFAGQIPEQVPLASAPLVTVLVQIRYPSALYIKESIPKFQSAIRQHYPELRQEQVVEVTMSPAGPPQVTPSSVWRFLDQTRNWTVSVTTEFISLETRDYKSRDDFIQRLQVIAVAALAHLEISNYNRIGIRYIDQIKGAELKDLGTLISPILIGLSNQPFSERIEQSLSQVVFNLPKPSKAKMVAQYGMLAKNTTYDPGALRPISEKSWVLDLDIFREFSAEEKLGQFDPDHLTEVARAMSERIYAFFRWATTDAFLDRYKGR